MKYLILIFTITFALYSCSAKQDSELINKTNLNDAASSKVDNTTANSDTTWHISIAAVGDIMLGSGFPDESYLPSDCGESLMEAARDDLADADVTFGNLEGAVLNEGKSTKGRGKNTYSFRMRECAVGVLKDFSFDVLSIANNHAFDFGLAGNNNAAKVIEENGIKHCGKEEMPYCIVEQKGKKIAFIGFATSPGTPLMTDIPAARELIRSLNDKADIIVVSYHGGGEGQKYKHITRVQETFLGMNRGNPYEFAHSMIDEGADLVIGHGPHVPRAAEVYKNRLIFYSLGNFCTYKQFSLGGSNGYAPIAISTLNENGEYIKHDIRSYYQVKPGILHKDPEKKAEKEIYRLSGIDFPESGIKAN